MVPVTTVTISSLFLLVLSGSILVVPPTPGATGVWFAEALNPQQQLFGIGCNKSNHPSENQSIRRSFLSEAGKSSAVVLTTAILGFGIGFGPPQASWAAAEDKAADTSVADKSTTAVPPPSVRRLSQKQYIAALGNPKSSSGTNAREWGLWTVDPGPRGVPLEDFGTRVAPTNRGPYGWAFDPTDWWLEEHGRLVEAPDFAALHPGRYLVTGGGPQDATPETVLEIFPDGTSWELSGGTTLADVTHRPCRSGRYTGRGFCSPRSAVLGFPVAPGAPMPGVPGCQKQDYAVLFVVGVPDRS